jgi:hypothetical protein
VGGFELKKITQNHMNKTRDFLKNNCRELEVSRFEYLFKEGIKEKVIENLLSFQNADGGFGNGIEPDFWLPNSSPMATWAAGQVLREIDADKNDQIVKSMLSYLANTFNNESGKWASVIPEINNYPHAPWWHWAEGAEGNWSFNPSVELAAFLVHWSDSNTREAMIGWNSIEKAVAHLMTQTDMDKHEINNFQAFSKIIAPHKSTLEAKTGFSYEIVLDKIINLALNCIDKNASNWDSGYVPLPLDFIENPKSPLCDELGLLIEENFEFYFKQMSDDGVWDISWEWGSYPEEFEQARVYWKGILAVERYKKIKAFCYLE